MLIVNCLGSTVFARTLRNTKKNTKKNTEFVCVSFKVAYTREMVEYRWKANADPVNILNMELAEFDLTRTEYSYQDVEYVAGM